MLQAKLHGVSVSKPQRGFCGVFILKKVNKHNFNRVLNTIWLVPLGHLLTKSKEYWENEEKKNSKIEEKGILEFYLFILTCIYVWFTDFNILAFKVKKKA